MDVQITKKPRVAVVGGGLAGLTCAKYLVDAGADVSIHEGLPYLGGRASTFRDGDGDWIEQGLHLFLGSYSEFRRLLQEIGQPVHDVLFWTDEIRFEEPLGPRARFGINPIYAPLRTLLGLLGQNHFLGPADKLSLLPLIAPAFLPFSSLRKRFDHLTVEQWWKRSSRSGNVLERVLRPFCRAIQFSDVDAFSAFDFLGWGHQAIYGLLHARLGGYRGARDELIFQPLARYLKDRGATIRTGVKLAEILYDPAQGRVDGFALADGTKLEADYYVAAVPAWVLAPLIPRPLRDTAFFANIAELPIAPAIAVQLWFDRVVCDSDVFRLVPRSVTPVYQDQSPRTYPHPGGSRLSVDIAPADEMLSWDDAALVKHTLDTLGKANPAIAGARLLKSVVLKHPQHLIRPLPGVMSRRPTQATPVPNLFLAGDWTQQEFFASQEGAVRGGKACAHEILRHLQR